MKRILRKPAIALAIISPVLAELVSGSTPPLAFLFPITLPFMIFFYGVGALLVREITIAWKLQWPGLLLLGGAFGIAAEAFIAGTWTDLTTTAADVRWGTLAGINWGIVIPFTLYHAVYSIGIPVFFVNRLFPDRIESRWVRQHRLTWFVLALWVVFTGAFMVVRFDPLPTAVALTAIALLIVAARRSRRWSRIASLRVRSSLGNRRIFLTSLGATMVIFAIGWWTRPAFPMAAVATNLVVVAGLFFLLKTTLISSHMDEIDHPEKTIALIGGAVAYLTLQGALTELLGALGMSLVAISMVVIMVRFWRRERTKPSNGNPASLSQGTVPSPV